jgi:hypothetical protein
MAAVYTPWISAREKEERRRRIYDNAPNVSRRGRVSSFLDFEPETEQVGRFCAQPRGVVFALTSFGEAQGRWTVFSKAHVTSRSRVV